MFQIDRWIRPTVVGVLLMALGVSGNAAVACTATEMSRTEDGFIKKIVAGSDKIVAYDSPEATTEVFRLELLQPYFVICETDEYLRISDLEALSVAEAEAGLTGFVRKDQSYDWPTREALAFSDLAFLGNRPEIVAWDDRATLRSFIETGDDATHAPSFRENIDATLRRTRDARPYPVLASDEAMLLGRTPRRTFDVLLPAALRPTDAVVFDEADLERATQALTSATIVIAFDSTGSMESFALSVAESLKASFAELPEDVLSVLKLGFVFYRDVGDEVPLETTPPLPVDQAVEILIAAAANMYGGGDPAEPILDATYYAAHLYEWPEDAGRKIVVSILNEDAKASTIGEVDPGDNVPTGLDAIGVARSLFEDSIPIIAVQAGPSRGQYLDQVLGTLASETEGVYIRWEDGLNQAEIADALSGQLQSRATAEIAEGRAVAAQISTFEGSAVVPLDIVDGEKLERLREAGVAFNIDLGEDGILVQPGYMMEAADLLVPQIRVDKRTLLELINLMSVLAVTGVDSESMRRSVQQSLAAIAGEETNPAETIAQTLQRQLGIQFRSGLLEFNLEFLDALTPTERASFGRRLQEAAQGLDMFLNANLEELDRNPWVWMPVSALP
ncbi:VWA domain-containing protein [Yoonia sp. 67-2]|nr:VWA domain-containing protein [Yoonia sp. 67-2]